MSAKSFYFEAVIKMFNPLWMLAKIVCFPKCTLVFYEEDVEQRMSIYDDGEGLEVMYGFKLPGENI